MAQTRSGYSQIDDTSIDAESPITASLMTALRDQWYAALCTSDPSAQAGEKVLLPERAQTTDTDTTKRLAPDGAGGVTWAAGTGAGSIGQAELKTALGEVFTNTGGADLTLPGGEYGFYPQVKVTGDTSTYVTATVATQYHGSTYATIINLAVGPVTGGSPNAYAQQRYVTASPPYDLGDGDIPLFIFGLQEADGSVGTWWLAQDPPWAHNGPTNIRPDFKMRGSGWKYKKLSEMPSEEWKMALRRLRAGTLLPESLEEEWLEVLAFEVTRDYKNSDMALVPHPFVDVADDQRVVLLDPVSTQELLDLHEDGESVVEMLADGRIFIGPDIEAATPPGVTAVAWDWAE